MDGKELLKDHLIGQDKILNIKFKLSSFHIFFTYLAKI